MKNTILIVALLLSLIALTLSIKSQLELKSLYCDLNASINAEREYIYPILRAIDNPDDYATDIKNPLTTNYDKYGKHCK